MAGLFVTATDTEVGKTVITGALTAAFKQRGYESIAAKPVASGALRNEEGQLYSEDAEFLRLAAGLEKSEVNRIIRYILEPALTPAVAAKASGVTIDIEAMLQLCRDLLGQYHPVLIEGVGGLISPLWENFLFVHFMQKLNLPGLLVIRPNLGTINHTVLTVKYAEMVGASLKGMIVNGWEAKTVGLLEESNLAYVKELTGLPILGKFPKLSDPWALKSSDLAEVAENYLSIDQIVQLIHAD